MLKKYLWMAASLCCLSSQAQTLSVGNLVWEDFNGNGLRDSGEPGIAHVGLDFWADNGDGIFRDWEDTNKGGTSTDENGAYQSPGLPPGNYFVRVSNWNFSSGQALFGKVSSPGTGSGDIDNDDNGIDNPFPVSRGIASALVHLETSNQTIDFGFYIPANPPVLSIGDLVWNDVNGNGLRDSGEPGISNVGLDFWADNGDGIFRDWEDTNLGGASTDENGAYQFTGLPPGNYFVRISNWNFSSGQALFGKVSSPGTGSGDIDNDDNGIDVSFPQNNGVASALVHLESSNQTIDFGFYTPPNPPVLSIGNLIWDDFNGNGLRDPDEPGIPNVGVNLYADNGDGMLDWQDPFVTGTGTDANGRYQLTGLPAGNYFVRVEGWNFMSGRALFGKLSSPGAASGKVDNGDNGNDNPFPQNNGIASAMITLQNGTEPDVLVDGDGTDSNQTIDFGFYIPANPPVLSIGDLVWDDVNGNGLRDPGEPGIANVGVNLYADNGDGMLDWQDPFVTGTGTDANGRYQLTGLPAGNYFVRVEGWNFMSGQALFGKLSTPGAASGNVDNDDNGNDNPFPQNNGIASAMITLQNGTAPDVDVDSDGTDSNQTIDFGFYTPPNPPVLSIGNLIWDDFNGNGLRDPGEPGIPNVGVNLVLDDGDGIFDGQDQWLWGTGTDSNGQYQFTGLPAGNYFVIVGGWNFMSGQPLFGKASSPGSGGGAVDDDDNGIDNPFPQNQGIASALIQLQSSDQTIDFGFTVPTPAMFPISVRFYENIGGTTLDRLFHSLKFPDQPDSSSFLSSFEWPGSIDNYGAQLRAVLHPPATGDYVFYLSSDDQGELWLSTDNDPAHKTLIAAEPVWNNFRAYTSDLRRYLVDVGTADERYVNVSKPIFLQKSESYYIEGRFKEGGGGDHLSVAWKTPGGPDVVDGGEPIAGAYFTAYDPSIGPSLGVSFVKEPFGQLRPAGYPAIFQCAVDGTPPFSFQWKKNGVDIPGANGQTYSIPAVVAGNSGERYSVEVSNNGGANVLLSREAELTVMAPPGDSAYQFVLEQNIPWDIAKAAAEQLTFNGKQGHLATITSAAEDRFIELIRREVMEANLALSSGEFWIGGFQEPDQASPGDGWFWLNGEGAIPGLNGQSIYANWFNGEPNDCCNTTGIEDNEENHLTIGRFDGLGWNDEGPFGLAGYVVEFDHALDTTPPVIVCPGDLTANTDPGNCSTVVQFNVSALDDSGHVTVNCSPASGSVFPKGATTVTCTATDDAGNSSSCTFVVTVVDREAPTVSCLPGANPSNNNVPGQKAGTNKNPDGFFSLSAMDNCDPSPAIYVRDSASSFVAGPFKAGDVVKIVQAPGGIPSSKPMADQKIAAQIQLKGDALAIAVDASGNESATVTCQLPPR